MLIARFPTFKSPFPPSQAATRENVNAPIGFYVRALVGGVSNSDKKIVSIFNKYSNVLVSQKFAYESSILVVVGSKVASEPLLISVIGISGEAAKFVGGDAAKVRQGAALYEVDLGAVGSGGGGGKVSKVAGSVSVADQPKKRQLVAVSYAGDSRSVVGEGASIDDGTYEIELSTTDDVIIIALDDFGVKFSSELSMVVGQRVRPAVNNGFVYECIAAGQLPASEPTWWTDGTVKMIGTVRLQSKAYYQPQAHAPITPAPL